ncbi:MAG TPA: DUF669 domain-containing protein [Candidatus Merdenecus merdavium]|nr:DUF669 domain-containing protein [Candidatus Merdenecus merdavium]
MSEILGRELGWEDNIEKDSGDFVLLPEGDYDFIVESFERARHGGSEKLPPCNKAIIKLKVETESGLAYITHNLFLHTITEGMLSAFFAGIGQKKKGEKIAMNWTLVPGSTGRAKVGIRKYTNKSGETREYNEIKKFYPKENPNADKGFEAGRF